MLVAVRRRFFFRRPGLGPHQVHALARHTDRPRLGGSRVAVSPLLGRAGRPLGPPPGPRRGRVGRTGRPERLGAGPQRHHSRKLRSMPMTTEQVVLVEERRTKAARRGIRHGKMSLILVALYGLALSVRVGAGLVLGMSQPLK